MKELDSIDSTRASSLAPLALAWLATATAIALALLPRLIYVRTRYDSMVALTAATVIGLAWYTYFTRQGIVEARTRDEQRTIQSRRALATAVLAELANTLGRLNEIAKGGDGEASLEVATLPALDRACELPELFIPETVLALIESRRRVRELQSVSRARDEHRRLRLTTESNVSRSALHDEEHAKDRVRFEAGWSYRQLVELTERLKAEGGVMPAAQPSFRLPQTELPPDPFVPKSPSIGELTFAIDEDDAVS